MRILKVKGVPDRLCSNPHSKSPRFVGKLWNDKSDPKLPNALRYDDVEEVIADHLDLRSALKAGDLLPADEATAALCGLAMAKAAAKKGDK